MALNFLKSLDADDIFISYSRDDGDAYVTGLEAALSKLGFSCFWDKRGTDANPLPPETLFQKIRACKTLVLVGTQGAIQSPENIRPEVAEFAKANGTSRIISISFDRNMAFADWTESTWYEFVVGKAREREDQVALETGEPRASIVEEIAKTSNYMKSKDRLHMYRNRALVGFLCLLAAGVVAFILALVGFWEMSVANKAASDARGQAKDAKTQAEKEIKTAREDAQKRIDKANEDANKEIERIQTDAQTKISTADRLTKAAESKRITAENQTRQAEILKGQAEADAKAQLNLSTARQLANRADTLLNDPSLTPDSILVAAESLRRVPTFEADQILRRGLELTPRPISLMEHAQETTNTNLNSGRNFSPDGQFLVTVSARNAFVWKATAAPGDAPPLPQKPLATLAHDGKVNSFTFSPDGKYLVTTSDDGFARVWTDWASPHPNQIGKLERESAVIDVAVSAHGSYLATTDRGQVHVWKNWQKSSNKPLWSGSWINLNESNQRQSERVSFSADESFLIAQTRQNTVRVWRTADGVEVTDKFASHFSLGTTGEQAVQARQPEMALTPDRQFIVAVYDDKLVKIFQLPGDREVAEIPNVDELGGPQAGGFGFVMDLDAMDFNLNSNLFAFAGERGVTVIDTLKDRAIATYDVSDAKVRFSTDGKKLAMFDLQDLVQICDPLGTAKNLRIVPKAEPEALSFSADGSYLATVGHTYAQVWETKSDDTFTGLQHEANITDIVFRPDGQYFASSDRTGKIHVWRASDLAEVVKPIEDSGGPNQLAVSNDGRYLAIAVGPWVNIYADWTTAPRTVGWVQLDYDDDVREVVFAPGDFYLAVIDSKQKQTQLWVNWDKSKKAEKAPAEIAPVRALSVAFSPNGDYMLTSTKEGAVQIWRDWQTQPREVSTPIACPLPEGDKMLGANSLAVGGHGKYLAVTCIAESARNSLLKKYLTLIFAGWESEHTRRRVLTAYDSINARFEKSGEYVGFSGFEKGGSYAGRVWSLATGKEVARMDHDANIYPSVLSPNGELLVTGTRDFFGRQMVRVWRWQPDYLRKLACQRIDQLPDLEDWKRYLPGETPPSPCAEARSSNTPR